MLYLIDKIKIIDGNFILKEKTLPHMTTEFYALFNKKMIINTEEVLDYPTITEEEKETLIAESNMQSANDLPEGDRLTMIEQALDDLILGGV